MLKKIWIKLTLVALLISFASCSKWLDLQPQDGITGAEFWQTKEQVQAAVTGIYASLLASPTNSRPMAETMFLWGELRADMIQAAIGATSEQVDVINVNILATNSIANWRTAYQVINYCNTVIDFAPGVREKDPTFTQANLNNSLAEAKAIRALMYFYLVRTFGDVPLKLKSTSSDKEIEQIAKSPQQAVLAQIVKDLNEAEPLAVFTHGNQAADKGKVTRFTINAMQADVYLWMDDYANCVLACDKVINSQKFGLIDGSNSNAWFSTLYANGNSNESIFELQFDQQALNSFFPMFMAGGRDFIASPRVLDEMYTIDFNNPDNKDIRADGASVRQSDQTIWKFVAFNNTNARAQTESYAHWIVYRYADVLLMKAEALNQQGKGQAALDLVYIIRNRARALVATDRNPDPNDKTAVANFILEERAREFAFEGKRWFDLLRFAKRNNYENLQLLLDMVAMTVAPDRQQSAITKFRDKNSHYLPVFAYEIQTNKALVQNPFYK